MASACCGDCWSEEFHTCGKPECACHLARNSKAAVEVKRAKRLVETTTHELASAVLAMVPELLPENVKALRRELIYRKNRLLSLENDLQYRTRPQPQAKEA